MREIKTIGIVGYGLIGGSFGLALKKYTDNYVIAIDNNPKVLEYVSSNALADEAALLSSDTIKRCDILYLALYPKDILEFMYSNYNEFKNGTIIVDLCGIKKFLVERFGNINNGNFTFIGAHPMAGKEKNGITVADADLYIGASFIITPTGSTDKKALELVEHIAKKIGFKNVIITDADNHDKMITYTSQLPHIMSVAYVLQKYHGECFGYYAGSFKDMTRVADINARLWEQLFKNNKEALTEQIDEYINALTVIKNSVNADDDELYNILTRSKKIKEWQDENYKY